jgi:hypothetical protein
MQNIIRAFPLSVWNTNPCWCTSKQWCISGLSEASKTWRLCRQDVTMDLADWRGSNAVDIYTERDPFKSNPGHQQSCLRHFLSRKCQAGTLTTSFQIIFNSLFINPSYHSMLYIVQCLGFTWSVLPQLYTLLHWRHRSDW